MSARVTKQSRRDSDMKVLTHLGPVGAEITGLDIAKPLSPSQIRALREIWLECGFIVLRNQNLSPEAQADFAAHFGELDVYPFMQAVPECEYVIPIIKEPDAKLNFGGDWHTDTSYKARPPQATVLYAVSVPPEGGDTLFADPTQAFQDLSPALQQQLERLNGVYTPKMVHGRGGDYRRVSAKTQLGESYGGNDEFAESEVIHPLIRTHPETGRKSIYCSRPHTHRIEGWKRSESKALIGYLTKHSTQSHYVTRLKWQAGTLVMWDNRCLFHNALNDYQGYRRHMHRVIIKGDQPR